MYKDDDNDKHEKQREINKISEMKKGTWKSDLRDWMKWLIAWKVGGEIICVLTHDVFCVVSHLDKYDNMIQ